MSELNDRLDDMVDAWHDGDGEQTIYEFMKMTREEYFFWVETCIVPQSYLDRHPEMM